MGLLNDRRRVLGGASLPHEAEIEYLEVNENTGRAYIDTEYIPTGQDIRIETDFKLLGYSTSKSWIEWFMAYDSESTNTYRIIRGSSIDKVRINCGQQSNGGSVDVGGIELDKKYHIILDGPSLTYAIGDIKGSLSHAGAKETSSTMKLFSWAESSWVSKQDWVFGRFYSFKLYKGGVLVLDLVPVRIGDEGFMYNKVDGTLFGNAGTGRFVLGKDV